MWPGPPAWFKTSNNDRRSTEFACSSRKRGSTQVWKCSKGATKSKEPGNDQFKRTAPKARSLLSVFDDQKKEEKWKPKDKRGDKHNSRKTSASTC